jgi:hypothetical protein
MLMGLIGWRSKSKGLLGWSILAMYLAVLLFNIWLIMFLWSVMGKTNGVIKVLAIIVASSIIAVPEFLGMVAYGVAVTLKSVDNAIQNSA